MDIMETIKDQIESNRVILYMKGSPNQPQCGFSARTVQALMGCGQKFAYVSRDLAKRILDAEEEHIDWLETQLSLMDRVGEQNYLQTAMKTVKPSEG